MLSLLSDLRQTDVKIVVPSQYLLVINIYLDFVNNILCNDEGQITCHGSLPTINDVKTLTLCFVMESFFADNTFFVYLMRQAYSVWNEFFSLYSISQSQYEMLIYLYTPYEFIPEEYRNRPSFFKDWLAINANKEVVLCGQGNDVYHTIVTYYANACLEVKAYHTVNGDKVGYEFKQGWYEVPEGYTSLGVKGQAKYRWNYKDGLHEGWYTNRRRKYRVNYENGLWKSGLK